MPVYRVRRERCIPYEIVIEAPDEQAAEDAAYNSDDAEWSEGCAYWQDILTEETDEEPDIIVTDEDEGEA